MHTEGLLTVGDHEHDDWGLIRGGDGKPLATTLMQCRIPEPQSQWVMSDGPPEIAANARRLVACWNALDGLDTEVIESSAVPSTALECQRLREVNAELLVACKAIIAGAELDGVVFECEPDEPIYEDIPWLTLRLVDQLRNAVAKAEGQS